MDASAQRSTKAGLFLLICHNRLTLFIVLVLLLSACALATTHYAVSEQQLAAHDPAAADRTIAQEVQKYGANNRLLYLLDRGMSLSTAGRLAESNKFLDEATVLSDQLYTESVSRHAVALLTNDNALPYVGEDFERVMIHLVSALNYAQLDLIDDALVECRRMETQLNRINDQYREKKNRYKEDAFAHYLSGILYEARGEINEAFLSYRKAHEIYEDWVTAYTIPLPGIIGADLLWTTHALGLQDTHKDYKKDFPNVDWINSRPTPSQGEIILVSMHGKSPYKKDLFFDVVLNKDILTSVVSTAVWQAHVGSGEVPISLLGQLVRVTLPQYVAQKSNVKQMQTRLYGAASWSASSVLMEDITAIAVKNLEDRMNRIRMKAIARSAIKAIAVRKSSVKAEKELGGLGGFAIGKMAEAIAATTEVADKRSWRTLPNQIHLTRIVVPAGAYQVSTEFIDQNGRRIDALPPQPLSVAAGKKRFVVLRTIY